MALDYEKFILKQTEWRGEVTNKLDNINQDVDEIKADIKEIKKLNAKRDVRTAEIAGGMTIIILLVGYVIQNGLG